MLKRIYDTCCLVNVYPKVNEYRPEVLFPEGDEEIRDFCMEHKMHMWGGDPEDLVSRYWGRIQDKENYSPFDIEAVIRITGDCPLIPKTIIEDVVKGLMEVDYVTNVNPRTYPDGYDCQGISYTGLEWITEHQKEEREHPFKPLDENPSFLKHFTNDGFTVRRIINPEKIILNPYHPANKLSVDTKEDLDRINAMLKGKK